MIEINFVELIQNCLAVASTHRDRLFRTRLSIITPLSDSLVRHTKAPIYGPRVYSTPPPSIRIYRPLVGSTYSRIDISGAKGFKTELELLQEFQNLHQFLQATKTVTSTQIPKLMSALSKLPVLSISSLAVEAKVSRDTARRWLVELEKSGKLQTRDFNGMKQYAYTEVLQILDKFVRYSATP